MKIILVGDVTVMSMDEELAVPITLALVDGYTNRNQKPVIGTFDIGNNLDLGLDFEWNNDNDGWEMIVKKRQDYEQPAMQKYIFYILIEEKNSMVQITINNIFDNAPVVTSDSKSDPCVVPVMIELICDLSLLNCPKTISGTDRF